jgi:hypothetical protein
MLDVLTPEPVRGCTMDARPKRKLPSNAWKPGQSGNPNGRQKVDPNLREAAKQYTMRSLEVLVDVMENGKKDSDRVAAANAILDRGHGKATQHIEVGDNSSLVDLLVMIGSGKTIDGDAIDVTPTDATPTDATPTDITPTDLQKPDDPQLGGE